MRPLKNKIPAVKLPAEKSYSLKEKRIGFINFVTSFKLILFLILKKQYPHLLVQLQ